MSLDTYFRELTEVRLPEPEGLLQVWSYYCAYDCSRYDAKLVVYQQEVRE